MPRRREAAMADRLGLVVHDDWAPLEGRWRTLEALGATTPYQRFDFVSAWYRAVSGRRGTAPFVLEFTVDGEPAMLLPLEIVPHGPTRIAHFPAGRQANLGGPVLHPALGRTLPGDGVHRLMIDAAGRLRIDGYALLHQPTGPEQIGQPLLSLPGSRPSPTATACLGLGVTGDETLNRVLSPGTRKQFGKKRRKLAELGPVAFHVAEDAEQTAALLDAFLRQKAARFTALGLPNPFADETMVSFLQAATRRSPGAAPALETFALTCGGEPVAVFGAASTPQRMSGSFICFDQSPEVARCSPGELLLVEVVRLAASRGHAVFDLGLGRGALKTRFCKDAQGLVDTMLPATSLGRAALLAMEAAAHVKDLLQRDERFARHARRVAGWLGVGPRD